MNVLAFPRVVKGEREHRHFVARPRISAVRVRRTCLNCGRPVRRSWRTGILHSRCFACRYLVMIYGTNITVTYEE